MELDEIEIKSFGIDKKILFPVLSVGALWLFIILKNKGKK